MTTLFPILVLESTLASSQQAGGRNGPVSLHTLVEKSIELEEEYKSKGLNFWNKATSKIKGALNVQMPQDPLSEEVKTGNPEKVTVREATIEGNTRGGQSKSVDQKDAATITGDTDRIETTSIQKQQLARGVSGLPMSKTPALVGAKPAHVQCDVDVDDIIYWNDPQGSRDESFSSPFATGPDHYLTFEPDRGGWNNIRMSMEIIFVLAAVTRRTLVLPPKAPMYLLGTGKKNVRSFGDFYNLDNPAFKDKVNVITMQEFLEKERQGLLNLSDEEYEKLKPLADTCLYAKDSTTNCNLLYEFLREVGVQPELEAMKNCLIFDLDNFQGKSISPDLETRAKRFCTEKRTVTYYDEQMHSPQLIHWQAGKREYRLLNHFYTFVYFSDPTIDNFYKRFVRDFLHYKDNIYCAAGKIVHALKKEAAGKNWSTLHVRRGDLQYKQVKIPAEEWLANLKETWKADEIIYIATDERNKTFFDPIKEHHGVRFLDDYWDLAGLDGLESNYLGMVDTIVASHGRVFAGTWFSTFTGYINRMRGYLGYSMRDSWYGWLPRKEVMHEWLYPEGNLPAREWPLGWIGIDGDEWIEHELEVVVEEADIGAISKHRVSRHAFHL